MKRYVIIEDERFAYDEISRMMHSIRPDMELAGWSTGVEQSVLMLSQQKDIDLIIADIQLNDGTCFDVFERVSVSALIIFTTAYDEYAIRAFKLNSIDYLLKPIEEDELKAAIEKAEKLRAVSSAGELSRRLQASLATEGQPKFRFLIHKGDSLFPISTESIAFFYSEDKYTFAHLANGYRYIIDYTLEELDGLLSPKSFFRISRRLPLLTRIPTRLTALPRKCRLCSAIFF